MIPQAHITAWRATAPWGDDAQVEQDLVLADHLGASGTRQVTPEPTPARTRQKQIDQASQRLREALGMREPD